MRQTLDQSDAWGPQRAICILSKEPGEPLKGAWQQNACWWGRGEDLGAGGCLQRLGHHVTGWGGVLLAQLLVGGGGKNPAGKIPHPFHGTSSCCLVPSFREPIKPVTAGNYRLQEKPRARGVGMWGGGAGGVPTGAVTPAWPPAREGADTKAPIKLLHSRQLLWDSGWRHDITGIQSGAPQPLFFLFAACLCGCW